MSQELSSGCGDLLPWAFCVCLHRAGSARDLHGATGGDKRLIAGPRWQDGELQLGIWFQRELSIPQTSKLQCWWPRMGKELAASVEAAAVLTRSYFNCACTRT